MGNGTNLGRVRGLGSAHEGAHGWWHHKVSAGSNLVLVLWFLLSMALLPAHDYATIVSWMAQPFVAVPLILLVVSTFYHFHHGLTVVIEDYQHDHSRFVLLVPLGMLYELGIWATPVFIRHSSAPDEAEAK